MGNNDNINNNNNIKIMTTKELRERLCEITPMRLHGHFKVTFEHRSKMYSAVTTNTPAIDAIKWGDYSIYTEKQALQALRNEVLTANNITR